MRLRPAVMALALALASCGKPAGISAPAPPHYVLEPSWQAASGVWFYPHEQFDYDTTGLATEIADPHLPLTTDGEAYDPGALAAAHQTLQLPAILLVTNLDNGRQIRVRLNDRGPDNPGRLIALTPRAALLLAIPAGQPAMVRVQVDAAASRHLADSLHDPAADAPAIAAPRGDVQQMELAPPPGARAATRAPAAAGAAAAATPPTAPATPVPLKLAEAIQMMPVTGGQIFLRASIFARRDYASRQADQLAGWPTEIEHTRTGRTETFQLRVGPFATAADADAALDQARRRGVTDSRIVIE